MTVPQRQIGQSELSITPLIFGGNVFGWAVDEQTSFSLLDAFVAAGGNCIDTADVYSKWVPGNRGGESETIIGKWLQARGNRDQVVILTKVGLEMGPDDKGLSRTYILRAVEKSLQRLQTDVIDLYQSHTDDAQVPLEETLGAYDTLIKQGKVRAIGASNYTAERLAEALDVGRSANLPRYQCLQPLYNLFNRPEYEDSLRDVCEQQQVGVIPYYSLANGFLTGKYRTEADFSKSRRGDRVKKYMTPRGMRILDALDEVSRQYSANPARIALAWLMCQPTVTAPIASATTLAQLEDLMAAIHITLDQNAISVLNSASDT